MNDLIAISNASINGQTIQTVSARELHDSGAKVLGVREHKLKAWMLINRWYYRDHCGRLCAYADKIAAGYLDTVPVEIRRSSGIEVVPQPVITQKGLARLAELLAKDGLLPGAGP